MTDHPKCYLVSCGSYSDYGVVAVFLTREEADEYSRELIESRRRPGEIGEPVFHEVNDVEEMPIGRPDGERLTPTYYAKINLLTGEVTTPTGWHKYPQTMAKPGQMTRDCHRRMRATDVEVERTSYVSQAHAEKLCVESRQEWLRLKGEAKS